MWKELYTIDDSVECLSDQLSAFADAELFREFLQRPLKRGSSTGDITISQFAGMAIIDYSELVSKYFRKYPVLYIDLKVNWLVSVSRGGHTYRFKEVKGPTFEVMLSSFDMMVREIIGSLCSQNSDLLDQNFCDDLRGPRALEETRSVALTVISWELLRVYQQDVVVLIDEYDAPMHSAIEHGYATLVCSVILLYCSYLTLCQANDFFDRVLSSLLKVCQYIA